MIVTNNSATGGTIVDLSIEETGTLLAALALGMITAKKSETRIAFGELHKQLSGDVRLDHVSFEKRMDDYWENPR